MCYYCREGYDILDKEKREAGIYGERATSKNI